MLGRWGRGRPADEPAGRGGGLAGALLGLAVPAVAAIPVTALLLLAYTTAEEDLQRDLEAGARLAVRNAEHVVDRALADLDEVVALVGAPCDAGTVDRLQRVVYDSPVVREIGLFDADLRVYCTNFGKPDVEPEATPQDRALFPAEGLHFRVFRTQIKGERSLVASRRLASGEGANALVAPQEFRNNVLAEASGLRGGLRLVLSDGSLLGQTPASVARGTPGYLETEVTSARLPLRIEGARPASDVRELFVQRVPRYGLVGLGLGVLAAMGFARAMRRRLSLETELRTALRRGELEVHYQPIIALSSGRCAGAEALVRWRHPRLGLVRPELFIAMAEETGLVMPMTEWMLRRVREELLGHFRGRQDFHVGVNLVAQHFRDEGIVHEVETVFTREGFDPSALMLEVTERQLVDDRDGTARRVMARLQSLGCTLALDDFGTGQSSLAYLERFHVDYLKVDKAFVDTIGTESLSRPVLDAVIDLGHRLDMQLIAEGVEEPHQAAYLRERGVAYAQGYHFSPPMPVGELLGFVARTNGGPGG